MLKRLRSFFEKRTSATPGDAESWLTAIIEKYVTTSGANVTADNAMNCTAVLACVLVISETIASLPLKVYIRNKDGSRDEAPNHPLYYLLHDAPNRYQTSFEFRQTIVGHLCLRGNAYCQIVKSGKRIVELLPLNPAKMEIEVEDKTGDLIYSYKYENGQSKDFSQEEIWHLKDYSDDGIIGKSRVTQAREAIGLAIASEAYGARFFANDTTINRILKHPGKLSPQARDNIKESLKKYLDEKRHGTMLLEEGLDMASVGLSNEDSQFLETREFQVQDIGRIYRVPGVLIGAPDKTSTYASAEQFFLSFVVHTIRPWVVKIEQSINRNLISPSSKQYFAEHVLDGLLRGDIKTRFDSYRVAREWGWLNADEIRAFDNMAPLPDGKGQIYLQPLNMAEAGKKPLPPPEPKPEPKLNEEV
jgi:HK97 family phage portal protein